MAGHDVFLRKQKQPSCFTSLRQHASKFEISLLLVGCIASVISGAMMVVLPNNRFQSLNETYTHMPLF